MENTQKENFRTGFVGIVGPTNSGKSTLLNRLVGEKISIVSKRAQTTYRGVRGILNLTDAQIVFVDTPGYQSHRERIAQLLNYVADQKARECDLWVWVFDVSKARAVSEILGLKNRIESLGTVEKRLCLLNKVDRIEKPKLLPLLKSIHELGLFSEVIPISALKGSGTPQIVSAISKRLPEGPALFPTDLVTDRSEQFLVAEYIREKLYEATRQEIPYSAWVEIEGWEPAGESSKCPVVRAVIHVDSSSRKKILIGKKGEMLKRIGTMARQEAEKLLGEQICLKLHIDVDEHWRQNTRRVSQYLELDQ